jgi:DNA repair protein RadC
MIKEMPLNERPRERLVDYGAAQLRDYELLAIVLRTGTKNLSVLELAKTILYEHGGLKELQDKTVDELSQIVGIGPTKAIVLLATFELGKRILSTWSETIKIASKKDVFDLLHHEMGDLKQEVLVALYLDTKSHLIQKKEIFVGGLNQSLIHPREIFKYAVKCSAFQVVLAHNHPSGDPEPSVQDLDITKKMIEAGVMMQIPIVDHVIVTKDKVTSIMSYLKNKSGK